MTDAGFEPEELIGAVLAGKYRIERQLGRGGMGIVYAAKQLDLSRKVAVKVLTASGGDLDALGREARAAAQLAHPHIVQVTDFVAPEDGQPFLVMELLDGESLDERIARKGPLVADVAIQIAIQMLSALAAAHAAGIIHRDVKPANVFLTRTAVTYDFVKLLDFGVARVGNASSIASLGARGPIGTPAYMAPEQIADGRADERTDLYAVGVCLYEMLAGAAPFQARNVPALLAKICAAELVPLAERAPEVDPDLAAVVARAMHKDPGARYATAEDLRAALFPLASALPVPSQDLAGETRRAHDADATTLEAPPPPPNTMPDAAPASTGDPVVPRLPPPPRSPSMDATKTRPSEPAARHTPSVPVVPATRPAANETAIALAAIAALSLMLVFAGTRTSPRAAEPMPAPPVASTLAPPKTCAIVPKYAPYHLLAPARLSVAGAGGRVVFGGTQNIGTAEAVVAKADPGEMALHSWTIPNVTNAAAPSFAVASFFDGEVGVLVGRYLDVDSHQRRQGKYTIQFHEPVRGMRFGLADRALPEAWTALPSKVGFVVASVGPSRHAIDAHDEIFETTDAIIPLGVMKGVDLLMIDGQQTTKLDVPMSEATPPLFEPFVSDAITGVAVAGQRLEVQIVSPDGAAMNFTSGRQVDAIAVTALRDRVHLVMINKKKRTALSFLEISRGAMPVDEGEIPLDGIARDIALTTAGDKVVLAWLTEKEGVTLLHVGSGANVREAARSLTVLPVALGSGALALSPPTVDGETWAVWSERILPTDPLVDVHVARVDCQ